MKNGPIILVEDDDEDSSLFLQAIALTQFKNQVNCFTNVPEALAYLNLTADLPFLIVSDINMSGLTGFDFKKRINETPLLRQRQTPFIFMSTSSSHDIVREAFNLCAQGYFEKPDNVKDINTQVFEIISYWKRALLTQ